MSQPKADPSMEEILASIRRIISEDGSEAPAPKASDNAGGDEDVLELTEVVSMDVPAASAPAAEPEPNAALASAMAAAALAAEAGEAARAHTAAGMAPEPPKREEIPMDDTSSDRSGSEKTGRLVSDASADQSARSFGALAAAIDRTREPTTGMALGDGGRTLEEIVRELLKPMLREWLDANLPSLVDRLVQKEIREMVRRAEER